MKTPNRTYTINDLNDLFNDLKDPIASKVLKYVPKAWNVEPPAVKTYCLHGTGVPTVETVTYDDDFPDTQPTFTTGDGDGTVNYRSLSACHQWAVSGFNDPTSLTYKTFSGATHNGILGDERLIDFIEDALMN